MNKKIPELSERVPTSDPFTVGKFMMSDFDKVTKQISKIWSKVIRAIQEGKNPLH